MIEPTFEEVFNAFLNKIQVSEESMILARKFFDHYQKCNWEVKVGKNKYKPMISWKKCVDTWVRNIPKYNKKTNVAIAAAKIFTE